MSKTSQKIEPTQLSNSASALYQLNRQLALLSAQFSQLEEQISTTEKYLTICSNYKHRGPFSATQIELLACLEDNLTEFCSNLLEMYASRKYLQEALKNVEKERCSEVVRYRQIWSTLNI